MIVIWLRRIMLGVGCALVLGSFTAVATEAQTNPPEISGDDCHSCHEAISTSWQNSKHSQVDKECLESLLGADESAPSKECETYKSLVPHNGNLDTDMTGVSCLVCHPSDPEEHPQKIMYTDTSSRLCGGCHIDTFAEHEEAVHGQEGMACIRCHNPHDNGLRAGGVQDTCRSCHRDEAHFYTFTDHAVEGLLCTDCHLQMTDDAGENGRLQHTFTVGMETCTDCHLEEMHYPLPDRAAGEPPDAMLLQAGLMPPMGDLDAASLNSEPTENSHVNLIILAAIIGMLFGLVGSPWLEKYYRRHEDEDLR